MPFITTGPRRSVARHSARPCTPVLTARRRFAEDIAATDDGLKFEDTEIRKVWAGSWQDLSLLATGGQHHRWLQL